MRSSSRGVAAVLLVLGAIVGTGCSSGSDSSSPTSTANTPTESSTEVPGSVPSFLPETLDHGQFVDRLTQICTTPELGGDIGGAVNATTAPEDVDVVSGAVETRLDLMRQMTVPDADQPTWAAVERAYDRYLSALTDLSDARAADDTTQSEQIAAEVDGLRREIQSAVDALGSSDCTV